MRNKIAIQTLVLSTNYGGILQAFALQHYLENKGYLVEHVSMYSIKLPLSAKLKIFLHKIRYRTLHLKNDNILRVFTPFINKYIKQSGPLNSVKQWREYLENNNFQAVVVGSDQVWRLDYVSAFMEGYFLDFNKKDIKKVAYAASFGKDTFNLEELPLKLLNDFDAISVREKSGVNLLKVGCGLHAENRVDPTLLLSKDEYIHLFNLKNGRNKKELFCYILDKDPIKLDIIRKVKEELKLHEKFVYGVEVTKDNYKDKDLSSKVSVESWLQHFIDAEFIVTDSYHGMIFSIIFNKPFLVIGNEYRGLARFESLLDIVGLKERLVLSGKSFSNLQGLPQIDYKLVNNIICEEKEKTNQFFNQVLNA